MARADLHSALAVDRDIFRASLVDAALLDPVVRLEAGVPGPVRPFTVVREYQGPQGTYVEGFEIVDRDGRVRYSAPERRVRLRGEAFEDRVTSDVESMEVDDGRPLELVCYVDGDEVDRVPVFLETASGGDARVATAETFRKALQKGAIMWVTVPPPAGNGRRRSRPARPHTQPVWFSWDRKAERIYLLDGPGEQHVPGLVEAAKVEVSARSKDHRSLVARLPATVEVVPVDDPRWEAFTSSALTDRLNLPDGDAAQERWRRECTVLELTPDFGTDDPEDVPAGRPTAGAAATAPAGRGQSGQSGPSGQGGPAPSAPADEEPHVEPEVDQEVFDRLIGEGKPERVARAQAKAAYVRAERKRLKAAAGDG